MLAPTSTGVCQVECQESGSSGRWCLQNQEEVAAGSAGSSDQRWLRGAQEHALDRPRRVYGGAGSERREGTGESEMKNELREDV
eukprot:1611230-Rhodomonas_salina.1